MAEDRTRRPTFRLRPQIRYDLRWEPALDLCTGQSGYGLRTGLRLWWSLRRGTWRDDWPHDLGLDVEPCPLCGSTEPCDCDDSVASPRKDDD